MIREPLGSNMNDRMLLTVMLTHVIRLNNVIRENSLREDLERVYHNSGRRHLVGAGPSINRATKDKT